MGEAFREGMYVFVGGILFCIASAILALLISGVLEMNSDIRTTHPVVYDSSAEYHVSEQGLY